MTATNHALTGAFIGLSISNPWLAVPIAFLSHFVLDAIPHFDVAGATSEGRIASKPFLYIQIIGGFVFCVGIVAALAILHPIHWLNASVCAFIATSPDILAIPRYVSIKRTGKDIKNKWWFWRFHHGIQWFQKPIGLVVEAAWLVAMVTLLWPFLV